ncbi:MAG: 1,4-dihydroxy-2-naphthoate polyprenyltransferase [Chlamydiia bacterium]|nr:1,4-dihydroxy-2-naphthoate polyprenyltransferase [Chlamydiia bacterium]
MPSTKNGNLITPDSLSVRKSPILARISHTDRRKGGLAFFLAARPRTWSASLCPVLIGKAMASQEVAVNSFILLFTLLFALSIQIGTNFANDYFDFIKGADTSLRIGPRRAVQQGWVSPSAMLWAAATAFSFALLFALPLILSTFFWSLPAALFCILLGILYTGGPKPLGYLGLGEILVFIFFGPVATLGTYFLQTGTFSFSCAIASIVPGLLSSAILIANNLRDEATDRLAGKNTLIVSFGQRFGKWFYAAVIGCAACVPISLLFLGLPWKIALSSLSFFAAIPCIHKVFHFQNPAELIAVLQGTSFLLIFYTFFFCGILS